MNAAVASLDIRRLGAADGARLHELMQVFAVAFDDAALYAAQPPDAAWHAQLLARDSFIALVALKQGAVVGGLTAYWLPKPERARSEIYLYDLAVDIAHRRQGIASALLTELKAVARERGAWVIFVQADTAPEDAPARALYARLGTGEEVLHYDIDPNDERTAA